VSPSWLEWWVVEFPVGFDNGDNLVSVTPMDVYRHERLQWHPDLDPTHRTISRAPHARAASRTTESCDDE
jgi:hypothetical protein